MVNLCVKKYLTMWRYNSFKFFKFYSHMLMNVVSESNKHINKIHGWSTTVEAQLMNYAKKMETNVNHRQTTLVGTHMYLRCMCNYLRAPHTNDLVLQLKLENTSVRHRRRVTASPVAHNTQTRTRARLPPTSVDRLLRQTVVTSGVEDELVDETRQHTAQHRTKPLNLRI